MIEFLPYITAFSLGLLGGGHCLAMCGGIVGALTMAIDQQNTRERVVLLLFYNIGRIASYCLIALLFYSIFSSIETYFSFQFMRYVAAFLLIAMGLYLAQWWQGLVYLEKGGAYLWRYIQPLGRHLLPVKNNTQATLLGVLWGWLPCGLIYSALAYSASGESPLQAVLLMFSFALGTLPALMLSGIFAERALVFIRGKTTRKIMAILMIAFGVWTLINIHKHEHAEHLSPTTQEKTIPSHHH